MANIVVANVCNMRCPYCFAETFLETEKAQRQNAFIALEVFEQRLDFLARSGISEVRLIGGEPTLHPQFPTLIERARVRGQHIVVFSHGLIREAALASLEALPAAACTVLVNMNASRHATGPDASEQRQRQATLARLGARALPGFTIFTPAFDMDFLLPIIAATGCQRVIRVGLAQAIYDGANTYLHPKQYPTVGARLVDFAQRAAGMGVRLEFDCGFVRCMFSDEGLAILEQAGTPFAAHCSPILDIDLHGTAIHCFPLTGQVEIPPGHDLDAGAMRAALAGRTRAYREAGIYRECSTCRFKASGACTGGCLAATMRRFRVPDIRLVAPV